MVPVQSWEVHKWCGGLLGLAASSWLKAPPASTTA